MRNLHGLKGKTLPKFEIMALQLAAPGGIAAPGVSDPMRRRIGALLDAGTMPTMRGNNLRLGDVVLQRTDGRDAPAMAEVETQMRARNIPLEGAFNSFGPAAPVRRGRGLYATDLAGQQRMITRRVGNENRVTTAGRRFYRQPYTRWVVHIPTYRLRVSTGSRFHENRQCQRKRLDE